MVAALSGIDLGKCLVVPGEVDGLADGGQASDGELSSHGCLQDLVFLFDIFLFVGYIRSVSRKKRALFTVIWRKRT